MQMEDAMPEPNFDAPDELSPSAKDPTEGPRDRSRSGAPDPDRSQPPGHLGPSGDPAEGKLY